MIYYFCKYAPLELLAAFGEEPVFFNQLFNNLDLADELTHRNVCSFSRAIITGFVSNKPETLVFTDCCDSMRRAEDILRNLGHDTVMLSLPRKQDECGRAVYRRELDRLLNYWQEKRGKNFSYSRFVSAFKEKEPIQGPYVAVMGGRLGDRLLEEIRKISPLPVKNNTCTGLRNLGNIPPEKRKMDEIMAWYVEALLSQPACMRMADITSRRALREDPNLCGIIYNTVKFCDYYGFEYASLRGEIDLPMLKMETDYTNQGTEQLKTRLEAFFEGITARMEASTTKADKQLPPQEKGYFAGIDSGSTSTNAVILDENRNLISFFSLPTGPRVKVSARQALEGALQRAGLKREQIRRIVTTGYGRTAIDFQEGEVTEITCHARGAFFLNPQVRTVIDIGGQDSKVIRLNEQGGVKDFVMNDKCAAGTGKFLEMMAQSLGLTLEEMAEIKLAPKENISISSMCSVFAQSEVVSLVAQGKRLEDIVCGLNRSIAAKVTSLFVRKGLEREIMMTGGVARNKGVVAAIAERTGGRVIVPEVPDICGALGAALIAME